MNGILFGFMYYLALYVLSLVSRVQPPVSTSVSRCSRTFLSPSTRSHWLVVHSHLQPPVSTGVSRCTRTPSMASHWLVLYCTRLSGVSCCLQTFRSPSLAANWLCTSTRHLLRRPSHILVLGDIRVIPEVLTLDALPRASCYWQGVLAVLVR